MTELLRATICAVVDEEGCAAEAEQWLEERRARLSFVSEQNGCGCCVLMWDIEGPTDLVGTLPAGLSAVSAWASSSPKNN